MDKEKALEIWDALFGKSNLWVQDCFGTWMYRNDYGDVDTYRIRPNGSGRKYKYGWEIDHIRPKSSYQNEFDANFLNNYEPMHFENNRTKADSFPHFVINMQQYRIVRCDICHQNGFNGYGIVNEKGERVDWKGKQQRYFKSNK